MMKKGLFFSVMLLLAATVFVGPAVEEVDAQMPYIQEYTYACTFPQQGWGIICDMGTVNNCTGEQPCGCD